MVGNSVTYETNGTDKIYYTYDANSKLVSMNLNGIEYYYIRNGQGDIIGLIDSNGTEVVKYTYDTWGKLISIEGTLSDTVGVKNPYRYRGYRYDTETGLYYLQSRYYNPAWGRFVNADVIIGDMGDLIGHNIFVYCHNNPINRIDPMGYSDDPEGDGPGKGAAGTTGTKWAFRDTYLGKYIRTSWNSFKSMFQGGGNVNGNLKVDLQLFSKSKFPQGSTSGKDVAKFLKKEGFIVVGQNGSHIKLNGPNGEVVIVPVHGNKDLPIGTLNSIKKQSGY